MITVAFYCTYITSSFLFCHRRTESRNKKNRWDGKLDLHSSSPLNTKQPERTIVVIVWHDWRLCWNYSLNSYSNNRTKAILYVASSNKIFILDERTAFCSRKFLSAADNQRVCYCVSNVCFSSNYFYWKYVLQNVLLMDLISYEYRQSMKFYITFACTMPSRNKDIYYLFTNGFSAIICNTSHVHLRPFVVSVLMSALCWHWN